MAPRTSPAELALWIGNLAGLLHRRSAWRLTPLLVGASSDKDTLCGTPFIS